MKFEIKKEKTSISKKIGYTLELITLFGVLCGLFLVMYVSRQPSQAPKTDTEELVYVFKETELYDILDFDQAEIKDKSTNE